MPNSEIDLLINGYDGDDRNDLIANNVAEILDELDRAIRMLNDRLKRIEDAEKLLVTIKHTGSHYQIIEKIDNYFKAYKEKA